MKPTSTAPTQPAPASSGPAASGPLRVLIVEDDTFVGAGLRDQLERLGHTVVGQAAHETEAVKLFRASKPDLILMDIRLDGCDGIDLSRQLLAERAVPVVIVSAFGDSELIRRAADAGVFGYLIKPATIESLAAQIAIACDRFREQQQLRHEKEDLAEALETRKLIDRAKGILIKRLKLSEPDAHRKLQVESQKRRITMAETARKIIDSERLLSG